MGMAVNLVDLFDVLDHYSPYTTRQMIGFLYCMGQMIHLATESNQDPLVVHTAVFKKLYGFLDPDNEEDTMSMRIAKLSDCADALDGFAIYIKFYVKFHLKIGDPQVEDTLQKMLVAVQTQEERAKQYYEDDLKAAAEFQEDEEHQAALDELDKHFRDAMESIGMCYS